MNHAPEKFGCKEEQYVPHRVLMMACQSCSYESKRLLSFLSSWSLNCSAHLLTNSGTVVVVIILLMQYFARMVGRNFIMLNVFEGDI